MPHTKCKEAYYFKELSEKAKEKARDWFREGNLDYEWWEFIYDDASNMGKLLGIDLDQKAVKLNNGTTRYDPEIYFQGFCTQGSGSSYRATWRASDAKANELKIEASEDKELHRLADEFARLALLNPELSASVRPNGDDWIDVSIEPGETRDEIVNRLEYDSSAYKAEIAKDLENDDDLAEALRDFNRWIYKQLQAEYDYLNADEQVDEDLLANSYEFSKEGTRL